MSAPQLADYWAARARSSFWVTREFSYRLGAALALVLGRLGMTPNMVSLLSLLTAGIGLVAALHLWEAVAVQAIAIFIALNVSYALDCADGLLARVGGMGSRFGAFFDKFIDVLVQAVIVGVLVSAAGAGQSRWIELPPPLAVAFALGARLALCVLFWLKEFEGELPQRVKEDLRARGRSWYFRRIAGLISDQPVYLLVVSVAWAGGFFMDALWAYHVLIATLAVGYLVALYREEPAGR